MTAAALAAVAAIGGLWAQAVTTYWSQQTGKDQLSQSREDSRREERAQASRITTWADPRGDGTLHVANRSPDPVSDVALTMDVTTNGENWGVKIEMDFGVLPPCSDLAIQSKESRLDGVVETGNGKRPETLWETTWRPASLSFRDADGKAWIRTSQSLNEGEIPPDAVKVKFGGMAYTPAKVTTLDGCAP
ncbi:hypothetical protein ACWD25_43640 [Streptomyces sp. NPDC002920]